jgi:hypothetical protein
VARLCDDGGTAECGIVPSRYLHRRAQRGKEYRYAQLQLSFVVQKSAVSEMLVFNLFAQ